MLTENRKKLTVLLILVLGLCLIALVGCDSVAPTPEPEEPTAEPEAEAEAAEAAPQETYKILYIMSYHSPWKWTDDQLDGFKYAMRDSVVEYKVFQMDTKRNDSEEWIAQVSQEAKDLIDSWQPDLVFTSDDNVQKYVVADYVGSDIPFVFSGVNADPAEYGFVGSPNVTGVVETAHIAQTLQLMQQILPDAKKIAVISGEGVTYPPMIEDLKEEVAKLPDLEIVSVDILPTYAEYQQKIEEYQTTADVIASVGIFEFKDEQGENVAYQDVLKWTVENSNVPDFSFWLDRVDYGTLFAVAVSGYEQGLAAGNIARGILVEGQSPPSFAIGGAPRGEPAISMARAETLGLTIDSELLLSVTVVEEFATSE